MLYEQFKQQQEQGVEKDFKFKITFSCEQNLQGKKLKRAIDNYHYLTSGTTKRTKLKPAKDDEEGISNELDDWSTHFKLGFQIYKVFDNTKGKLLSMIQRIDCITLNTKMETPKSSTTVKYTVIGIKPKTHR